MTALIAAVFVASLMGSLHCAGMCGAFVAFAVGIDGKSEVRRRASLQAAYNVGRLLTYVTLGAIAGGLGNAFDAAGQLWGVSRVAVFVAGLSMVIFGTITILRLNGVRVPHVRPPKMMERAASSVLRVAVARPPMTRAFITGLTTTLLPCGWLYAFVITAAGTGHPLYGALTMAVFWLGTLPMLIAVGSGVQALASRLGGLGKRVPVITTTAVILIGLLNVLNPDRFSMAMRGIGPAPDREHLVQHVHSLNAEGAPPCHDNAQGQ